MLGRFYSVDWLDWEIRWETDMSFFLYLATLTDYWNKNEDVPSLELKALMSHLLPDSTGFLRQLGNLWEWWRCD